MLFHQVAATGYSIAFMLACLLPVRVASFSFTGSKIIGSMQHLHESIPEDSASEIRIAQTGWMKNPNEEHTRLKPSLTGSSSALTKIDSKIAATKDKGKCRKFSSSLEASLSEIRECMKKKGEEHTKLKSELKALSAALSRTSSNTDLKPTILKLKEDYQKSQSLLASSLSRLKERTETFESFTETSKTSQEELEQQLDEMEERLEKFEELEQRVEEIGKKQKNMEGKKTDQCPKTLGYTRDAKVNPCYRACTKVARYFPGATFTCRKSIPRGRLDNIKNKNQFKAIKEAIKRNKGKKTDQCPQTFGYTWDAKVKLCYRIYTNAPTHWPGARYTCQRLGSRLVNIKNKNQFTAILAAIRRNKDALKFQGLWIGGIQIGYSNLFKWTDGTLIGKDLWYPGEPNNPGERCLELWKAANYAFNDRSCITKGGFICERPIAN